jgi:uncharacterized RDD family membrane protein YckC
VSQVVTGEAVVLQVRVAQAPSRALALAIDWTVQGAVLAVGLVLLIGGSAVGDQSLRAVLSLLFTIAVIVGYPVAFETMSRGRSLGKLALGLRVVGDDGGPERFRQALFRGLAGVVELWMTFGAIALVSSLISVRGKRLGDVFAGTIVTGERGASRGHPPPMPRSLAPWAATLELSQLPTEVANAARQYLIRQDDLNPQLQAEMARRIAAQVAAHVSPPPPAELPAPMYLTAVLAERRRRDELRLATRAAASLDTATATNLPARRRPTGPAPRQPGGFAPPA